MCLVSQVSGLVENLYTGIFADTINVINVKLCMIALLFELYLFTPPSVIWPYFKVTAVSNSFNRKFCVPIRLGWNFVGLSNTSSKSWIYHYFWLSLIRKCNLGFFSDTVELQFSKLCMILILLRVYHFIPGMMTLTLFQGHKFVRIMNCKHFLKDSCPLDHCRLNVRWQLHALRRPCTVCFMLLVWV